MKTDDESEEAEEPPGNNSGNQEKSVADVNVENDELWWARRHDPGDQGMQPKTRNGKTGTRKKSRLVFRKTELHDRPPGARADRRAPAPARWVRVAEELGVRIAALDERVSAIELRLDQEIKRLERRILTLELRGGS
jgi:hypothetical protein